MKRILALLFCILSLGAVSARAEILPVMVSLAPQEYILKRIAGPLAECTVMVSPGADAHTYEPKPGQMVKAAQARLYLAQKVEFEQTWLRRLVKTNPGLVVVNTLEGIELMPMEGHHHHAGEKGKKEHSEMEMDIHTWTSPKLVKVQAVNIARVLASADPPHAAVYQANLESFSREIDSLDAGIRDILKSVRAGSEFLVFHPGWAYFARDYGLKEQAIESEGKEPGPRKLKELIEHARESKAKAVFVQPQFSRKAAQTVADAIGARLIEADDLAEDWSANLLKVAKELAQALAK